MTNFSISGIVDSTVRTSTPSPSSASVTGATVGGTFATALNSAASQLVDATTPPSPDNAGGLFIGYEGPVVALGSGAITELVTPAPPSPWIASATPNAAPLAAAPPAVSALSATSAPSALPAPTITSHVSASGQSVSGTAIVNTAEQYLATPYVWGGSTPAGFDCSGLVQYVFARWGIHLPRTSEQQATVGRPVTSLAAALPGDLLFFAGSDGTASSPGHVAIYVGGDQMIDAPYTGSSVRVESIPTAGSVVAIRRVVGP